MIPRGRLDIKFTDILAGFYYCLSARSRFIQQQSPVLKCLSVRSGFDLTLRVIALPAGSEILVTDVNIPGMFDIIRGHNLKAIPMPLNKHSLAISAVDFEKAITPSTKAVLFTHLFGGIMEMEKLVEVAKRHGLFIFEDCAQAFNGSYTGNSRCDITMFSFGMIKTNTALGGALLYIRDNTLIQKIAELQNSLPVQSKKVFAKKLLIALLIQFVSSRFCYGAFYYLLRATNKEPDDILKGLTRGFSGKDLLTKLRHKPSTPLLRLLDRKIKNFNNEDITNRKSFGRDILCGLPAKMLIGGDNERNTFWVLPVEAEDPDLLIQTLRTRGFDATAKASSLIKFQDNSNREASQTNLSLGNIVYLPVYPQMTARKKLQLLQAIETYFRS